MARQTRIIATITDNGRLTVDWAGSLTIAELDLACDMVKMKLLGGIQAGSPLHSANVEDRIREQIGKK